MILKREPLAFAKRTLIAGVFDEDGLGSTIIGGQLSDRGTDKSRSCLS